MTGGKGRLRRPENKAGLCILGLLFIILFPQPGKAEEPHYPAVEQPAKKFFVGEKLVYSIRYLGIPIGRAEGEVREVVEIHGKKAYHVVVRVSSNPVVDLIHKIRGEHHTYVDVKHLYSLRYEVKSRIDSKERDYVLDFDHWKGLVTYAFPQKGRKKTFRILKTSQDQLSLGYYFRTLVLKKGRTVTVPVSADQKNWTARIQIHETCPYRIAGIGSFTAIKVEPTLPFINVLSKEHRAVGWISLDERRIPLEMTVKAPVVGSITARLTHYTPGETSSA